MRRTEPNADAITIGSSGASSLTAAELRLLPFLSTHLTYKEIGERLFVSRNTVKPKLIAVPQARRVIHPARPCTPQSRSDCSGRDTFDLTRSG